MALFWSQEDKNTDHNMTHNINYTPLYFSNYSFGSK